MDLQKRTTTFREANDRWPGYHMPLGDQGLAPDLWIDYPSDEGATPTPHLIGWFAVMAGGDVVEAEVWQESSFDIVFFVIDTVIYYYE